MPPELAALGARSPAAVLVAVSAVAGAFYAFAQNNDQPSPITDLLESSLDRVPSHIRSARGRMFDLPGDGVAPRLQESDARLPVNLITSASRRPMEELPADLSDVVVTGSVARIQPFMSQDERALYTEFTVGVSEVIKAKSNLIPMGEIAIVEPGGAIRLPTGRVIRHQISGYGEWPKTGGRYVFFLNYVPAAECYRLLKTWKLVDGRAVATAPDDVNRMREGRSHYAGMDEKLFVEAVRQGTKR